MKSKSAAATADPRCGARPANARPAAAPERSAKTAALQSEGLASARKLRTSCGEISSGDQAKLRCQARDSSLDCSA